MEADAESVLLAQGQAAVLKKLSKVLDRNPHPATGTIGKIMALTQALGMMLGGYLAHLADEEHDAFQDIIFASIVDYKAAYISDNYGGVLADPAGNA